MLSFLKCKNLFIFVIIHKFFILPPSPKFLAPPVGLVPFSHAMSSRLATCYYHEFFLFLIVYVRWYPKN